jgi:hypothetical protein
MVLFCAALKAARLLHRGRGFRLRGYYTVQKIFIFFWICLHSLEILDAAGATLS